jgi:hypothetical protein
MTRVVMQEEPAASFHKLISCSTNSLNQTRLYFHRIFLIHRLTWWNKFFCEWFPDCRTTWQLFWFFNFKIDIYIYSSWTAWWTRSHDMYVFLFVGHTGYTASYRQLQLSQVRNWINSSQTCSMRVLCSSDKQGATNLTQISHFPRSSIRIFWIVSLLISSSSSIIRWLTRRSVEINSRTVSNGCSSFSTSLQPSQNL